MSKTQQSKRKRLSNKNKRGSFLFPLIPTHDVVPIPGLVLPYYVEKDCDIAAVNLASESEGQVVLSLETTSKNSKIKKTKISTIGGLARIIHSISMPNNHIKLRLHVQSRVRIKSIDDRGTSKKAWIEIIEDSPLIKLTVKQEKLISQIKEKYAVLGQYDSTVQEHSVASTDIYDPSTLADLIVSTIPLEVQKAQTVLSEIDPFKRLELVEELLNSQVDAAAIKERVSTLAQSELGKFQHEELLRAQLRQIQTELGEIDELEDDLEDLDDLLAKAKMPNTTKKEAEKQLRRLKQLHPDTSEAALARTYLDWIISLPWAKKTHDRLDLKRAKEILDQDHYGLTQAKERILDYLGVRKLRKELHGPILLLVGPPGVGKTSLGRSIARSLGRRFVRVSLGGLRDEAEISGHRRTYIGALPGRIIQGLKTAGTMNPVFMLDELDKIGSDFRGDPASVLLEVLDPEQNKGFEDHYLNVPFDLSGVMFIATANISDSIPHALLDRMEVIEISGYTNEEKLHIAKQYLLPQEKIENGLEGKTISASDHAIMHMISGYTREAGVRELRRIISTVFRKIARRIAEGNPAPHTLTPKLITKLLGPVRFLQEKKLDTDQIGVVTGLAWTPVGGEILTIEASLTPGKGSLSLTGQLGEVMRESAMAALTYVLSNSDNLGIDASFYETSNVHVHVPEGAIPKDGPSAGIAIATALISLLTKKPMSRNVAMTGEMTLRGRVLQIGGLKQKALAALQFGVQTVVIPKANERELTEFPKYLLDKITFVPVETMEEAIETALLSVKSPTKTQKVIAVKPHKVFKSKHIEKR